MEKHESWDSLTMRIVNAQSFIKIHQQEGEYEGLLNEVRIISGELIPKGESYEFFKTYADKISAIENSIRSKSYFDGSYLTS